jgi:hypothetical protein
MVCQCLAYAPTRASSAQNTIRKSRWKNRDTDQGHAMFSAALQRRINQHLEAGILGSYFKHNAGLARSSDDSCAKYISRIVKNEVGRRRISVLDRETPENLMILCVYPPPTWASSSNTVLQLLVPPRMVVP